MTKVRILRILFVLHFIFALPVAAALQLTLSPTNTVTIDDPSTTSSNSIFVHWTATGSTYCAGPRNWIDREENWMISTFSVGHSDAIGSGNVRGNTCSGSIRLVNIPAGTTGTFQPTFEVCAVVNKKVTTDCDTKSFTVIVGNQSTSTGNNSDKKTSGDSSVSVQLTLSSTTVTTSKISNGGSLNPEITWSASGPSKCDASFNQKEKWMFVNHTSYSSKSCDGKIFFTTTHSVSNGTYQGTLQVCAYNTNYCDTKNFTVIVGSQSTSTGNNGCTSDSKSCGGEEPQPKDPPPSQPQEFQLSVQKSGSGSGSVSGDGISCGNDCRETYKEGDEVRLTASPLTGSTFSGWSGACSGMGMCKFNIYSNKNVTANFQAKPTLTVINPGNGGQVSGDGIDCGNSCNATYNQGQPVTLKVTPDDGYNFTGWGGDCSSMGNNTQCFLNMNASKTVVATFVVKPQYPLTVTLQGNGSGTVSVIGSEVITCSNNICSGSYMEGTQVKLIATHSPDSTFGGWQGPSTCNGMDDCSISMTVPQTVTATFNNEPPTVERLSPPEDEPQELDIALTFKAKDTEDGVITTTDKVKVRFKKDTKEDQFQDMTCTANAGGDKSGADTVFTCQPPIALDYSTKYVWKVTITDQGGLSNQSERWYFETVANQPPTVPEIKEPAHQATEIDPNQDLTLSCTESVDHEGKKVTYDFYFGDDFTQPLANCNNLPSPTCIIPAEQLESSQDYFWQCAAKDEDGYYTRGGQQPEPPRPWKFQTQANQPPSQPTNLVIKNGGNAVDPASTEIDREQSVEFSWTASEDPEGDAIQYQVCYQPVNDTDKTSVTCYPLTSETSENSTQLDYGTAYEVFVVAEDSQGNIANSETVTFKTKAAPVKFTLEAKSGYANTLLKWGFADTVDPNIVKYRILRVEGQDADFSAATTVAEIKAPTLSDYDEEVLEKEKHYCYLIEALDSNGDTLYQSNKDCVIFGETTLSAPVSGGLKGESIEIPLTILNGGNLRIMSSDIWLRYDGSVIEVEKVENGKVLPTSYTVDHTIDEEIGNIKVVRISISTSDDPPPTLQDEGPLVEVMVKVIGENGKSSPLELVEFVKGKGGSSIQDQDLVDIPLSTKSGNFDVKRRTVRDGNTISHPRFYVGEAYVRGDLNGNGTIQTVDAVWARFIGTGKKEATPEQRIAGDINVDGLVNSADANMIIYYALHQEWPGSPPHEIIKTRKLRRDAPIILSLEDVSGVSGSELTAMLRISNLVKLSAMNLSIAFDNNVVEIVKVEKTGLAEETQFVANPDNEAGMIHIGMDSQTPLNGDGDIAKITLRLVSGGSVRSTPLTIAQANLYDLFGRDFVISALQRTIQAQHGEAIITDIPEPPVIEDRTVETSIEDLLPTPSTTTGLHSATCQLNDHSGNPIAGATVTMGDKTVITDEYGYCAIVGLIEDEYIMTVSKDGYIFLDEPCNIGDENTCRLNFVNLNVGMAAPALCQVYAVNDKNTNDSEIFTVSLDDFSITLLAEYPKYDLEALDIDPRTDIIYLASGDNAGPGKKGYLYVLDGETGELFPVGSTDFAEIEDLAFSSDGTLWAWAKGDGLITIDLITGKGTLVYESEWDVEGLTIQENEDGSLTFYAAIDTELWFYNASTETLDIACTDLPGETEALEMIPGNLILIGIDNNKALELQAIDPATCDVIEDADIPTRQFDDVEGIAWPTKACAN